MSRITIHGTQRGILQPYEIDNDPVRGLIVHETSEFAADTIEAQGLASFYYQNRVAFRWEKGGTKSKIVATYSGGQLGLPDDAISNWQLVPNEVHKSVLKSPFVMDIEAEFPGFTLTVRNAEADWQNGNPDDIDVERASLPAGAQANFDLVLGWLIRGETHFAVSQPVLRRTFSVSNYFNGTLPGQGGNNALFLMGTILGLGAPTVIQNQLASIAIPTNTHTGYAWSWLQKANQSVTGAQNRAEVSTEFWWDEWNTNLYGNPS